MKMKHVVLTAMVAMLAAGVAVAGDMGEDVHKVTGEVLMMTPESIQLATEDGTIKRLAITEASDVDERVNKGDRVDIWYTKDRDKANVVLRSSGTMSMEEMKDEPDLQMIKGEVVAAKPGIIHLATDKAEIVQLEVGEDSDLDTRVNAGDYIKVWYRQDEAGSRAVVKSSRTMHDDGM
jgi:hypothetical protein